MTGDRAWTADLAGCSSRVGRLARRFKPGAGLLEPGEIRRRAAGRLEHEQLGYLIRMQRGNARLQRVEPRGHGLDEQQYLGVDPHLAVPAIGRRHARQRLHARGEALVDERTRDARGGVGVGATAMDNDGGHGDDQWRSGPPIIAWGPDARSAAGLLHLWEQLSSMSVP